MSSGKRYELSDLTIVLCVRLHEGNPWVRARLQLLRDHYDPLPSVVVVDFGSEPPFCHLIEETCLGAGFAYVHEVDDGVYSAARAHNVGARAVQTPLLFFCDVDCFGSRDLMSQLIRHANAIELGTYFDQLVSLPAYHLTEATTAGVIDAPDPGARHDALDRAFAASVRSLKGEIALFVAPYSNCVLVRRDFFELTGGYDESFRGHGSEDFEFLLRACVISDALPMPDEPSTDAYSPMSGSFYKPRKYRGFRRMFELMSLGAEVSGLRVAHLAHPRPKEHDAWYIKSDRKRVRFDQVVAGYLADPVCLLDHDCLPRNERVRIQCQGDEVRNVLALRLHGYALAQAEDGEPSLDALDPTQDEAARRGGALPEGAAWSRERATFSYDSYLGGRLALPRRPVASPSPSSEDAAASRNDADSSAAAQPSQAAPADERPTVRAKAEPPRKPPSGEPANPGGAASKSSQARKPGQPLTKAGAKERSPTKKKVAARPRKKGLRAVLARLTRRALRAAGLPEPPPRR